ncbi:MGT family glycosyltransferase [Streptomyces sp. NBC_01387]|uniref:macrolide family glycosyltransferase n=1 Tax=unclassified Streptomyces TaxID=2593676 RepID=UPI002023CDF9|nr:MULTISPECIES: macrolide family glycosyltransferase [unclassified Streptomyces]MCX4547557.1 MGT family glycosyltransferase [Streptomyces sp. NBC_01500]WSV53268.1 MGT family glycosyltransferase [Streptomyces sp. NBC_01014]
MSELHVAFLPFPAFGHINTTLPIVAELVRRGHRVTFATNERFAPLAAGAGADVLRYESWLASRKLPDTVDADYLAHEPVRSIDEAIATVPLYEAGFAEDVPDVLLYDVSTFAAGRVLARKWKRPAIELFATFASNEHYSLTQQIGAMYADEIDGSHPAIIDFFVKQGQLWAEHGLDGMTLEEFNAPADGANLVFLPRRFQPAQETFDDRFAFVGTCIGSRATEPEWQPPAPDRPVVLVSMGSFSYDHQDAFVRTCVEAFTGTPWHVVMSVGEQFDLGGLGEVPDNIQLMRWVPQLAVLERADVFVSHAGMNSVMESMYFGTPVVALPHMPEQRLIASRLAELGLGVHLPPAEVTAERLRTAVATLASDEGVRTRVRSLSDDLRATDGPSLAADYIEARARG